MQAFLFSSYLGIVISKAMVPCYLNMLTERERKRAKQTPHKF